MLFEGFSSLRVLPASSSEAQLLAFRNNSVAVA
jgi:hypothetical protein